ncbi:MAG: UDP-N-acetylmuramate--L-alanine ligase [Treponema sp.]|jgi:UDP-N-acetylmuramate--alanine ligase|nr:UDP-N-acetylmuramate--L-alanine ligase [Treponema sp.]
MDSTILEDMMHRGGSAYFIGIKGSGMCALAELMHGRGIAVSGSDTREVFYTDAILKELGIPFHESFDASHIHASELPDGNGMSVRESPPPYSDDSLPDVVIYSAAYSHESNAEVAQALKLGIPMYKYTDALGAYSSLFDSSGITGVHGKTTTTALAGALIKGVGLPAQVLAGSAVSAFGGRSVLNLGAQYFVAETCEYRRHFLSFCPRRIILTSVESDHQDCFPTFNDIKEAFLDYGRRLPPDGELIYCADDSGASEVASVLKKEMPRLQLVPYGFSAKGDYRIESYEVTDEKAVMRLQSFPLPLNLRVPGKHTAVNAAAALALTASLVRKEFGGEADSGWNEARREGARKALEEFSGSRRRSEILGEAGGILFMDDYAHHPTAIKTTLAGIKDFYPRRRLVVSFMSHTYTRTASLLDQFAASFEKADVIVLHKIYASAREVYSGGVDGRTLFEKTHQLFGGTSSSDRVLYIDEPDQAAEPLMQILKPGDLFLTMGAGDNWRLGKKLFDLYCRNVGGAL